MSTRDENYVTETIFVPLYNRSMSFRNLISKKFGLKGDAFGERMVCTCDKRKGGSEYGNPDAKTNLDNIVEIKTRISTPLTTYEKKKGMDGNGYEKYLKENNKLLLYVFPDGYDEQGKIDKKSAVIYWSEILTHLKKENINDPFISQILEKVDCDDDDEIMTLASYKSRIYELCARIASMNKNFKVDFNKTTINHFPYNSRDDWNVVCFSSPNGETEDFFCLNDDEEEGVLLSFSDYKGMEKELKNHDYKPFKNKYEDRYYKDVMPHTDFTKKNMDYLAKKIEAVFSEWWELKEMNR